MICSLQTATLDLIWQGFGEKWFKKRVPILTGRKLIHSTFAGPYIFFYPHYYYAWSETRKNCEGNCGTAQSRLQCKFLFHAVHAV